MAQISDLISTDIEKYLKLHQRKSLLRFITCGSVDDGKSTVIGRLLYESKILFEDQLAAIENDSRKFGTQGGDIDFALLVDGLAAEREQGITIDVAYRFFSTDRRTFIVADTPGHEQYTRNMITGASTADVAVILIDARKGVLTQTRRHSYLVSLIGIRKVLLAINKMDLVDYSEKVFDRINGEYCEFAKQIGLSGVQSIPLSALKGDNMLVASEKTPWYSGPTLMGFLETCEVDEARMLKQAFRMPVQWVNRPNLDFRGFAGFITSGVVRPGDRIIAQPSGRESKVARVVTLNGDLPVAAAGQSVTLTLEDEIDISRGDILSMADTPAEVADQFEASLVWMIDEPMIPGRPYLVKIGTQIVTASITELKYKINVKTMERLDAKQLGINEIGVADLALDRPVAFDAYTTIRDSGGFILIDRVTNNTVGAGMVNFALRSSRNVRMQPLDVNKALRSRIKNQLPAVLWFTGLSGAGKSTIANLVESKLTAIGQHTYLLDGDNVRHGLNKDLGFTNADRVENIRRIAEVARLMVDAGLIVITAFISPFRSERAMACSKVGSGEFIEVYVNTPLEVAEARDVKGLYKKARRGEITNFTGISSPYEAPESAEIVIDTLTTNPDEAAEIVLEKLRKMGVI
ncbi:sulfate adenylyltransferase subunit CysN [Paraburkholderia terricola]|uniref:Multifunctional fusion protein n=1 Tax=Paraburkholderia terricola TaxID=169427 RepID=A0ABU1M258_9BURK|nr:sulfate adenylyltransferase subunit CysN [Paraburkholderia terricola]MDR6412820.1 bifunctional enzyme CysN/CysC [Paraburkholderia terricola]MDR6450028.1 bifunctional enzyme CysN/CysC [Paraburkholderia terricola]MDR6484908.1 bifunctional enzyme CysN/CysC [Paraburkholderia terricola]